MIINDVIIWKSYFSLPRRLHWISHEIMTERKKDAAQVFVLVNGGATYWGECSEQVNLDGKKLLGHWEFRLWYVKCKLPARHLSHVEGTIQGAKWKLRLEISVGELSH